EPLKRKKRKKKSAEKRPESVADGRESVEQTPAPEGGVPTADQRALRSPKERTPKRATGTVEADMHLPEESALGDARVRSETRSRSDPIPRSSARRNLLAGGS